LLTLFGADPYFEGTNRRAFIRTAGGVAGAAGAVGGAETVAAQEDGGEQTVPDYGGWFSGVGNFGGPGSTVDTTGQETATVEVGVEANGGALGFGPPAVHVDNSVTVIWEWTGEGGGQNVVSEGDGPLDSGEPVATEETTYEYTFEDDGIFNYGCEPHEG